MTVSKKQRQLKIKSSLNRTLTQVTTGFTINNDEVNITSSSRNLVKTEQSNSLSYIYSKLHLLISDYCSSIVQFMYRNPLRERSLRRDSGLSQDLEEAISIRTPIKRDDSYRRYLNYLEFIE